MFDFKIADVLLSDEPQFLGSPMMLCRSTKPWYRGADGEWLLKGPGTHDFMTFFNALSIQKWRKYTVADAYRLHVELKGSECTLVQTRADSFSYYSEPISDTELVIPASDEWQSFDIDLVAGEKDVITSFKLETDGDVEIRNSYYSAVIEERQVREVELALCTTTFKKEEYITRNIALVKDQILGCGDSIAKHFKMHVVDNGRSLDVDALSSDGVEIHPNDNAGGAGGFARGMIEAMEQTPKATHVLLMDDDVLVSTESIKRTFNLLSIVNDAYSEAFISGAMMNMDEPNVRWEELGFMGYDGCCHAMKGFARMDVMHDVVMNESFDVPSYMPKCEDQNQQYAAWWYCVIPMTQIEKNGLPLPIFVRYDDVEYSLRCKPKFISMNSICIWHMPFYMRYNAAQECYQTTRNSLINSFTTDMASLSNFEKQIDGAFRKELSRFNYKDAALILQGLEDFLAGPDWIMQPIAQQAFMSANKNADKYKALSEIYGEAKGLGVDLNDLTPWKISRDVPFSRIDAKAILRTCNGQRGVGVSVRKGKTAVADVFGFPIGQLIGADALVVVDVPNNKGAIRYRNSSSFATLWSRYAADVKRFKNSKEALQKAYKNAKKEMTSVSFWKDYLSLN